jgi:hypothetical protein
MHRVVRQLAVAQPAARVGSKSPDTAAEPAKPFEAGDLLTQQPQPSRFPWLSRLSTQLSLASNTQPKFQSADLIGNKLNATA